MLRKRRLVVYEDNLLFWRAMGAGQGGRKALLVKCATVRYGDFAD